MKIIFFGTPIFAASTLAYLIDKKYKIVAVVTSPDSKKGRGKKLTASPVKVYSIMNSIPVLQPKKLRDTNFVNTLKSFNADLFVVVAFRMLPEIIWQIPEKGTINLHTSLLPEYKGAAPINWVLINGEKKSGVSTFFINSRIDCGDILLQKEITLSEEITAAQLHNNLIKEGGEILVNTLESINKSRVTRTPQEDNKSTFKAPKITKELLRINWDKDANEIHNLIRGLSPLLDNMTLLKDVAICPSAWFFLENPEGHLKRIKIHRTKVISSSSEHIATLKTDNKSYLHIITKKDAIAILNLQAEGKKPMTIQQFLQGNKITKEHKIS
tara:strand:+ start:642 stop:1622 length:981 start_codon:yes stop_codon:yes gene_type:complete